MSPASSLPAPRARQGGLAVSAFAPGSQVHEEASGLERSLWSWRKAPRDATGMTSPPGRRVSARWAPRRPLPVEGVCPGLSLLRQVPADLRGPGWAWPGATLGVCLRSFRCPRVRNSTRGTDRLRRARLRGRVRVTQAGCRDFVLSAPAAGQERPRSPSPFLAFSLWCVAGGTLARARLACRSDAARWSPRAGSAGGRGSSPASPSAPARAPLRAPRPLGARVAFPVPRPLLQLLLRLRAGQLSPGQLRMTLHVSAAAARAPRPSRRRSLSHDTEPDRGLSAASWFPAPDSLSWVVFSSASSEPRHGPPGPDADDLECSVCPFRPSAPLPPQGADRAGGAP